jgi:putative NIF3 family GTP cyclohydrolase 1 type 2
MDALSRGAAGWLADELKLAGRTVLEPTDPDDPDAGLGIIGDLPKPVAFDEFAARLHDSVDREFWIMAGDAPETVSRVAYCTGSGGSLIAKAAKAGADVFVTGDVKYHQALEAETTVIDVGHFSLEERMLHIFAEQLQSELGNRGVTFKFFKGLEPFQIYKPEEE